LIQLTPDPRPSLLYLASQDPRLPLNGAPLRVGAFIRYLSRHFNVHLIYLDGASRSPRHKVAPAADLFPDLASEQRIAYRSERYFLFSPMVLRAATEAVERHRPDVVLCDYGVWGLYGHILARRYKVPFIYSSHNVEWRACLAKAGGDPRRLPLSGYYFVAERLAVRHADLLVAISPSEARYFQRWRENKPSLVIPQGIDDALFFADENRPPQSPRRIVFCGNLSIPFNRDVIQVTARAIVPEVVRQHPDVIFEFIGARPPARSPHPKMVFTGFVNDYSARLRTCDAVIVPILQGFGFPTKTIEALASGRPTVATPVGVRGLTHGFPHLFVRNIADFPKTLLHILDHPDRFGAAEAAMVKAEYGWNHILYPLRQEIMRLAGAHERAVA
jgi:glycosyltransferase involved in cell wall biosynthesis